MKCTKCERDNIELRDGQFKPAGKVPGWDTPKHNFVCKECLRAIDSTKKEVPVADW